MESMSMYVFINTSPRLEISNEIWYASGHGWIQSDFLVRGTVNLWIATTVWPVFIDDAHSMHSNEPGIYKKIPYKMKDQSFLSWLQNSLSDKTKK